MTLLSQSLTLNPTRRQRKPSWQFQNREILLNILKQIDFSWNSKLNLVIHIFPSVDFLVCNNFWRKMYFFIDRAYVKTSDFQKILNMDMGDFLQFRLTTKFNRNRYANTFKNTSCCFTDIDLIVIDLGVN